MALRTIENLAGLRSDTFVSQHEKNRNSLNFAVCHLDCLAAKGDLEGLQSLLYNCVWQRFSLVNDDHNWDSSDKCLGQLIKARHGPETMDGIDSSDKSDEENYCSTYENSTDLQAESEKCSKQRYMEWEFECDPTTIKRYCLYSEILDQSKANLAMKDYPVPAWFLMSAIFTGCPKLIDYLLNLKETTSAIPCSHNISYIRTEAYDGCPSLYEPEARSMLSSEASVNGNKKTMQITNHFVEIDVKKLRARRFGCHTFVDIKVACEFPITDTWIHQSVNLLVSPLHLACWRLDLNGIQALLQHGANPNGLALEQVPKELQALLSKLEQLDEERPSQELSQHSPYFLYSGLLFYQNQGLTPLHFIALGLRSPPKHSLLEGSRAGIIHDPCAAFRESQCCTSQSSDGARCFMLTPSGKSTVEEEDEISTKCALVVSCLEALLQAGACPDMGGNTVLGGAYPLDLVLQPATKVYYAPSAARTNHSSDSLRMHDLEHNVHCVLAACDVLLRHEAHVSPRFTSACSWRPELLDCFHLTDSTRALQLSTCLIRLGLFSDKAFTDLASHRHSHTGALIQRFIADVLNKSVSAPLTSLILHWCSLPALHAISRTITRIADASGWNEKLRELADIAVSSQLRSLKQTCNCVILKRLAFSFPAIHSLPLPPRLKRELTELYLQ